MNRISKNGKLLPPGIKLILPSIYKRGICYQCRSKCGEKFILCESCAGDDNKPTVCLCNPLYPFFTNNPSCNKEE
jgi:hypothetical protein